MASDKADTSASSLANLPMKEEERHVQQASLVGQFVQVTYPGHLVLKGLVTGYYKSTETLRINYFSPNPVRLDYDTGSCIDGRVFYSERRSTICPLTAEERISDSTEAVRYYSRQTVQIQHRNGKVGYMLGKLVKADWASDGVFLGVVVQYKGKNKFEVVYADNDREWGEFKESFTTFELEEGGYRKVSWFDMDPVELCSYRPETKKMTITESHDLNSPRTNKTDTTDASRLAVEMAEKVSLMENENPGAFTTAFLTTSRMESIKWTAPHDCIPQQQTPKTQLTKKVSAKRSLEDRDDNSSAATKLHKREAASHGPKRGRVGTNGASEIQPASKKLKKRRQRKEDDAMSNGAAKADPAEALTKEPAGSNDQHRIQNAVAESKQQSHPPLIKSKERSPSKRQWQQSMDTSRKKAQEEVSLGQSSSKTTERKAEIKGLPMKNAYRSNSSRPKTDVATEVINLVTPQGRTPSSAPTVTDIPSIESRTKEMATSVEKETKTFAIERPSGQKRRDGNSSTASVPSPMVVTSPRKSTSYSSVEIGLEMQNFATHLENLTQSRDKIEKATKVARCVANCGGARRVIDAILVQIKEPVGAERKVALFYLMDSILNSAHKHRERSIPNKSSGELSIFLSLIEERLKEIVEALASEYDSYSKLEKVLELWKERRFFAAESMDRSLSLLHEKSNKHARFIEDDRLRSQGLIPYYVRSPKGPECNRVILSKVFARVQTLSEYLYVPEALKNKRINIYTKSDWDDIDMEIRKRYEARSKELGELDERLGDKERQCRQCCSEKDEEHRERVYEEGEIPSQPPLPTYSPPADVDDPHFVPPLPSETPPDDPNFVPPLPTSPPPGSPDRRRNKEHTYNNYTRYNPSGGPGCGFQSPMCNDRSYRSARPGHHGHHPTLDPRLPISRYPTAQREYEEGEWYRRRGDVPPRGRQEIYRHDIYPAPLPPFPPNHAAPMQRLPAHPVANNCYPYPPPQHPPLDNRPPPHHDRPYTMRNPPRRHW